MANYQYRCLSCGPWEARRPIGTAAATERCPACGHPSRREYTPPLLGRTPRAVAAARQRDEASRDEPAVVSAVPPRRSRPAPQDPRHRGLPRP